MRLTLIVMTTVTDMSLVYPIIILYSLLIYDRNP
jgi:hypothetical protein